MSIQKALFAALASVSLFSLPAFAADDLPNPTPVDYGSDEYDWTGFYAGTKGGLYLPRTETNAGVYNGHGVAYGAFAGVIYQTDIAVIGAEAHIKGGSSDTKNGSATMDYDLMSYGAKAKLGYAMNAGAIPTLVSATAGAVRTTFDFEGGDKVTATGLALGVDVDMALGDNLLLGFEITHEMYSDVKNGATIMDITNPNVMGRVGFKF